MKNSSKNFWDEAFRYIVLKMTVPPPPPFYVADISVVSVLLVRTSCPYNNCFVDICLIFP
jgi:hypothetical protein